VTDRVPAPLRTALSDLVRWLEARQVPAVIIGGVAASALGRPRLTQDIDALAILPESEWPELVQAAGQHGIVPRIEDALDFARRSHVLLMRHVDSSIDLDITFGALPFERDAVAAGSLHDIGGIGVRLPRVEDLLVMKAVAHRPRDLEDIRGLLAANPDADVAAARRWIREFAQATGQPDLLGEFDKLLEQTQRL
jgi:hypothetical protein